MRSPGEKRTKQKETKLTVSNAMVVPTLLYECETWTVQKWQDSRLQATEMRFLRRMEGLTMLDRVKDVDIRHRLQRKAVVEVVKMKQKVWKKKVDGMKGEDWLL